MGHVVVKVFPFSPYFATEILWLVRIIFWIESHILCAFFELLHGENKHLTWEWIQVNRVKVDEKQDCVGPMDGREFKWGKLTWKDVSRMCMFITELSTGRMDPRFGSGQDFASFYFASSAKILPAVCRIGSGSVSNSGFLVFLQIISCFLNWHKSSNTTFGLIVCLRYLIYITE